jgi:hypothetical protein
MSTETTGPDTALSESSKPRLAGRAGMSVLITASVATLVVGILIGNAARKRIDRWSHGISVM